MAQNKTAKKDTEHVISTDVVFQQTEADNSFENFEKFDAYVKKHIKYIPHTHGSVTISFKTEINGSITNTKVIKSLNRSADSEALRLIKTYPYKWKPNTIDGKPETATYTMPITFK